MTSHVAISIYVLLKHTKYIYISFGVSFPMAGQPGMFTVVGVRSNKIINGEQFNARGWNLRLGDLQDSETNPRISFRHLFQALISD
jgi:hypothetical protein